jgi:hypothetical protein
MITYKFEYDKKSRQWKVYGQNDRGKWVWTATGCNADVAARIASLFNREENGEIR